MTNIVSFPKKEKEIPAWDTPEPPLYHHLVSYFSQQPPLEYDFAGAFPRDLHTGVESRAVIDRAEIYLSSILFGMCLARDRAKRQDHADELLEIFLSIWKAGGVARHGKFIPDHLKGYFVAMGDNFHDVLDSDFGPPVVYYCKDLEAHLEKNFAYRFNKGK